MKAGTIRAALGSIAIIGFAVTAAHSNPWHQTLRCSPTSECNTPANSTADCNHGETVSCCRKADSNIWDCVCCTATFDCLNESGWVCSDGIF